MIIVSECTTVADNLRARAAELMTLANKLENKVKPERPKPKLRIVKNGD